MKQALAGNDVVRLAPVQVERRNSLTAQVTSGVAPGDRLVVHPPDTLADGVRIRVRLP